MAAWLSAFLQQVIDFAGSSPTLVGLILAIAACAEAVIVVGALFPGEAMVLAVAAAAGIAGLDLLPLVVWTTAGAVIGDGISFWIGHKYGENIASWSYLKKHPGLLTSGEAFIEKHGTKSIVIARFLPGLRAIVPVAAGLLKMPPVNFYIANFISAVAWAVLHVLPAAGLGVAFKTLGAVSGRLTLLVGLTLVILFVSIWLASLLVRFAGPPLVRLYGRQVERLGRLSWPGARKLAGWLDPEHPHLPGMAFWVAFLLLMTAGFIKVLEDLISGDPLVAADVAISQLMQNLRAQPVDDVMLFITSMADSSPMIAAAVTLVGVLVLQRAYLFAAWAGLTILSSVAFVPLIKGLLHKPRPMELYAGADAYSFPSGHTTITVVLFSVLAVLVARKLTLGLRLTISSFVVLWVGAVGLSRIYLGAHWPSDVLGGFFFGAALTAVFAMLINHLDSNGYNRAGLAAAVLAAFIGVGVVHARHSFDENAARYRPVVEYRQESVAEWLARGWERFPHSRIDIKGAGKEPFQLQFVGKEEGLVSWLEANGWKRSHPFGWRDGIAFVLPRVGFNEIAPLPRLHNGAQPVATFVRTEPFQPADERLVLRFWATHTVVKQTAATPAGTRLLLGALRRERLLHPFGMASVLQPLPATEADVALLADTVAKATELKVQRTPEGGPVLVWSEAANGR